MQVFGSLAEKKIATSLQEFSDYRTVFYKDFCTQLSKCCPFSIFFFFKYLHFLFTVMRNIPFIVHCTPILAQSLWCLPTYWTCSPLSPTKRGHPHCWAFVCSHVISLGGKKLHLKKKRNEVTLSSPKKSFIQ